MSAQTANSQLSFQLPSLSYIDAKWEEPNLRMPVPVAIRSRGLGAWLSRQVSSFIARRRDSMALAELSGMSAYELADIGLTRADLSRAFKPGFNTDLRSRGL